MRKPAKKPAPPQRYQLPAAKGADTRYLGTVSIDRSAAKHTDWKACTERSDGRPTCLYVYSKARTAELGKGFDPDGPWGEGLSSISPCNLLSLVPGMKAESSVAKSIKAAGDFLTDFVGPSPCDAVANPLMEITAYAGLPGAARNAYDNGACLMWDDTIRSWTSTSDKRICIE